MSRINLYAVLVLFLSFISLIVACSNKKSKSDEPLYVTTSNLDGTWFFVRSESMINGEMTYIDEFNYQEVNLPLADLGLQAYSVNFQGNYFNGFPYRLSGNVIQWSLMSPVQESEINIVVASLTEEFLVLHYEYDSYVDDSRNISGYTDIMYKKM